MFESPEEALEYIRPLVPDMYLARTALAKGIGAGCPEWVVDGILFLLSNTLMMEAVKQKILREHGNHWIPNTIPYSLDFNTNSYDVN